MANDQSPLLGALGLCRKAGKLLYGSDRVRENVLSGKVSLVLLASDASKKTAAQMRRVCEGLIPCKQLSLSMQALAVLTPKPAAVFGVADEQFARLCAKYLN